MNSPDFHKNAINESTHFKAFQSSDEYFEILGNEDNGWTLGIKTIKARLNKKEVTMKTRYFLSVFSLLLFTFGRTESQISDREKKEALQNYTKCMQVADQWLFKLDSSDYQHLETLKIATGVNKDSVLSFINKIQKTYGKIKSREFLGAHIWSGEKLLTYFPDIEEKVLLHYNLKRSEDGFYIINPKNFGFTYAGQMFAKFPKAKYIVLMYRSVPTNESYAEELLILQYDSVGSWEVFTYKISDDI